MVLGSRYNARGYLTDLINANSGYVYQHLDSVDAQGQFTQYTLGHGKLTATAQYRHDSGTMRDTQVTREDGTLIHRHEYFTEDAFMNLTHARNSMTGMDTEYTYDTLNRLTQYRVTQTHPNVSFSVDYAYDAVGNLRKKTDYSANPTNAYRYAGDSQCAHSTFPANGVCQVITLDNRTVNFAYDQRGNLTQGDGLTLTYNHFDKPIRVLGTGAATVTPATPPTPAHLRAR